MRISDWSSDVCTSDLRGRELTQVGPELATFLPFRPRRPPDGRPASGQTTRRRSCSAMKHGRCGRGPGGPFLHCERQRSPVQIGRASCREGVCQYVEVSEGARLLKKKNMPIRKE